jgi:hypothetical protein
LSSRGYFIGQIVDDLDAIASQVRQRCKLGQTDLNKLLEDFFKEILNLTFKYNLRNLNIERSNVPGLDLGDQESRVAYQITSQADARKVNETLAKITPDQEKLFDHIYILIIGDRPKNYKIDVTLGEKHNFKDTNILGITELCRFIMTLEFSDLQAVHRKIADEQRRVRIELEPQMPDGTYQTSVLHYIEPRPDIVRSDACLFVANEDVSELLGHAEEGRAALNTFINHLSRLPRITREFLGWMLDNADEKQPLGPTTPRINADYMEATCKNMPDYMSTIRLLTAKGFIEYEEEHSGVSGVFWIKLPSIKNVRFSEAFMSFAVNEKLSLSTLFSTMNFSPFGPCPSAQPKVSTK